MKKRTVIAEVESDPRPASVEFSVDDARTVTLRFPNAVPSAYGYGGRTPFVRSLTPDEAEQIGLALVQAARRVRDAEAAS